MDWMSFVLGLIPSLGASLGWFFDRRKRKSDHLSAMQRSIDLLTENYTETLDRWTKTQEENRLLKEGQNKMLEELAKIRKENAELKKMLDNLKKENQSLLRELKQGRSVLQ